MSSFVLNAVIFIFLHGANIIATDIYMEKFKNYSIYQVTAFNNRERAVLYTLYSKVDDMIFTNGITNEASIPMNILVDKCCTREFETMMQSNDIEYVRVLPKKTISVSGDIRVRLQQHLTEKVENILEKEFLCYNAIRQWVEHKIKKNSILKEIKIGKTYEKRDIFVLKLSTGIKEKAVFLMGGEEGRDWSSPAILLNLIDYMLNEKKNSSLMKYYDFYILPIFNPDGYIYSMMKDRLWSKNSRIYYPKIPCSDNVSAVGITVDRNWYFNNRQNIKSECDPVFMGLKPLSEAESISVSKFLDKIALRLMAFINIRGFENLITIPYSFDKKYCNNYDVLIDIAAAIHDSVLKKHNSTFHYGLTSNYLYNFTGNVADWVKKELNTPIVYTFYMKVEPYILPSAKDVAPLTTQLWTMITTILLPANTLYGHLFNRQIRNTNAIIIVFIFNIRLVCMEDFV